MKGGFYFDENGNKVLHAMQTPSGVQKGLKTILQERGLWNDEMKKADALEVLKKQPDFCREQLKAHLVEVINSIGSWVDFYSKYYRNSISLRCFGVM